MASMPRREHVEVLAITGRQAFRDGRLVEKEILSTWNQKDSNDGENRKVRVCNFHWLFDTLDQ
jgi:hypothetical protein